MDRARGGGNSGGDARARFSQAVFRAYWERDENIADAEVIGALLLSQGFEPDSVLKLSASTEIRDELRSIVDTAAARGVFGVPTFFVGEEMFWGKDRLDFVERWLKRI